MDLSACVDVGGVDVGVGVEGIGEGVFSCNCCVYEIHFVREAEEEEVALGCGGVGLDVELWEVGL